MKKFQLITVLIFFISSIKIFGINGDFRDLDSVVDQDNALVHLKILNAHLLPQDCLSVKNTNIKAFVYEAEILKSTDSKMKSQKRISILSGSKMKIDTDYLVILNEESFLSRSKNLKKRASCKSTKSDYYGATNGFFSYEIKIEKIKNESHAILDDQRVWMPKELETKVFIKNYEQEDLEIKEPLVYGYRYVTVSDFFEYWCSQIK